MITVDWGTGFALAAALLAGLARGFTGFGAALILMPVLASLVEPQRAIPILQLVDTLTTLPLAVRAWPRTHLRDIGPLLVGYGVALPLGILILLAVDPAVLTRVIGLFVLLVALAIGLGVRNPRPPTRALSLVVGATAGASSGAVGIGGPPVVLFWLAGQDPAARVRANIMVFFACSGVLALSGLGLAGLVTMTTLWWTAALAPAYALGLWLGARAFDPRRERQYRRVALAVITMVGLITLAKG